jgi:hypothetical protein
MPINHRVIRFPALPSKPPSTRRRVRARTLLEVVRRMWSDVLGIESESATVLSDKLFAYHADTLIPHFPLLQDLQSSLRARLMLEG